MYQSIVSTNYDQRYVRTLDSDMEGVKESYRLVQILDRAACCVKGSLNGHLSRLLCSEMRRPFLWIHIVL